MQMKSSAGESRMLKNLRRVSVMLVVVLPVVSLVAALAFRLYPGETASFGELWVNALILVFVGPSLLAMGLIVAHSALIPRVIRRWHLKASTSSVLVGAALGTLGGAMWSIVVYWGWSVVLLGLLAGTLYGALSPE